MHRPINYYCGRVNKNEKQSKLAVVVHKRAYIIMYEFVQELMDSQLDIFAELTSTVVQINIFYFV